ncbi:MAG: heparan-alpha-glucosaminide N-acetyltransferase [Candidatus Methanoperedens sp.]|nr:heparan-alpha-glucosaminide N-acetyltransferase [Candidatus Methanoperedens sp.]MCZ7395551.1 heparan-alpha-glucosaminide N-acetyltransferase [Candidatus Methanoperedens sp.]
MTIFDSRLKEHQRLLEQRRIQTVDLIRGVDIVLMILFNYSVTLSYFRLINMPSNFLYLFVFPRAIALIFIFISGVAAHISFEKNKENFSKKYLKRGGKLLIFAAFITLFTYIFVPEGTIFFGILHFFSVSSFLVPFFIRYNKLNLIGGLLIILSGFYLQITQFDFSYLFWLGFMPKNFSTFDYFPLIPWLGVLMLGIYSGKYFVRRTTDLKFESRFAAAFMFLGKNSLTIYLIHQPVLIFLLIVLGFKIF